eukprot:4359259-Prymnesium_polylepis.1
MGSWTWVKLACLSLLGTDMALVSKRFSLLTALSSDDTPRTVYSVCPVGWSPSRGGWREPGPTVLCVDVTLQ